MYVRLCNLVTPINPHDYPTLRNDKNMLGGLQSQDIYKIQDTRYKILYFRHEAHSYDHKHIIIGTE